MAAVDLRGSVIEEARLSRRPTARLQREVIETDRQGSLIVDQGAGPDRVGGGAAEPAGSVFRKQPPVPPTSDGICPAVSIWLQSTPGSGARTRSLGESGPCLLACVRCWSCLCARSLLRSGACAPAGGLLCWLPGVFLGGVLFAVALLACAGSSRNELPVPIFASKHSVPFGASLKKSEKRHAILLF